MLSQGTEGEIQTQCVVGSQLWSISSKASCMAHLWSVLPGTCINWAYNWIVVFISSTLLLSSLGYGLQRKCLYLLVLRKLIECTLSSSHAHHCVVIPLMRNYCQLRLTSDNVRVPRATVALQNTKEMQNRPQETACLNGNNQPKPLIFLWLFRLEHKRFTCTKVYTENPCDINRKSKSQK